MIFAVRELEKSELVARDGSIGTIEDVYFDDQTQEVRYFVANTGGWLSGRRVLLSPAALHEPVGDLRRLEVGLTREQVERSPGIESDRPVSRQQQEQLHAYYGWPIYWGGGAFAAGAYPAPLGAAVMAQAAKPSAFDRAPKPPERAEHAAGREDDDPHLRSVHEVRGYRIEAADGAIGHLDDFLVDAADWKVRYLVVDTRNWWPGKKVLVAPEWMSHISWREQRLFADVSRQSIQDAPEYDPSAEFTSDHADRLRDYYAGIRRTGG